MRKLTLTLLALSAIYFTGNAQGTKKGQENKTEKTHEKNQQPADTKGKEPQKKEIKSATQSKELQKQEVKSKGSESKELQKGEVKTKESQSKELQKGETESKGNNNKETDKEQDKDVKQAQKKDDKKPDHENNGNAYGKNKGELSGREFGQQRAADAKAAAQSRKENAGQTIKLHEVQIQTNESKISDAREKVKLQKQKGEISAKEEQLKLQKITLAETKVKEMKVIVDTQKKELEKVNAALEKK